MNSFLLLVNRLVSASIGGLVAVIVGFASSVALIYQAVITLGGDTQLAASWLLALGLTMGVTSIGLSLYYRVPILIAWSTPGAALLLAGTQNYTLNEAIAGFMCSAILIFLCGITGWFEKLVNKIPGQLASAMLAGILLNFGIGVFDEMNAQPTLVAFMLSTYFVGRQLTPKFTMLLVLLVSIVSARLLGLTEKLDYGFTISEFTYIAPVFSLSAILGIGVPLFIVTMAAQNLPGIAVLKAHHYKAPVSSVLSVTGCVNFVAAPFGSYAINLAAITAAICMTDEVSSKPQQRYWASVAGGFFYILMAISAEYLMNIFSSLPSSLILALAGIALFATITNSFKQSLTAEEYSEASIVTVLVTSSDLSLWGVSSVLWGLMAGCLLLSIQKYGKNCVFNIKRE
ncbi:benzoate/H(+) symporter BenE family transporter [Alteromonas lipotrueiana]|uniref:benzoate/H(+) symporter BenE family transporter n=1 Tax=Alteromonas lipotrueiana TaxID=2803815 RepID=UPI003CCEE82C